MLSFFYMKNLLLGVTLSFVLFPSISFAQDMGLVPCDGSPSSPCTTEMAVTFANNLISWLITMLGVIAVIALMFTGFQLLTSGGDSGKWRQAKTMFTNIVIGIIIILAAWLVVDTIMRALTNKGLDQWTDLRGVDNATQNTNPNNNNNNNTPLKWHFDGSATGDFRTQQECITFRERALNAGERVGACYES